MNPRLHQLDVDRQGLIGPDHCLEPTADVKHDETGLSCCLTRGKEATGGVRRCEKRRRRALLRRLKGVAGCKH